MQSLTPTEMLKVLKLASESKRNHAMILFAFRFGMRASEVCDLRLSDIDRKNGTVTIHRIKRIKDIGRTPYKCPGPAAAICYASPECVARCAAGRKRLRLHESERRPIRSIGFLPDVSERCHGSRPAPEKRHPHCCKHSLGFAMVAANRSLTTIQNALGHRSVASTGIYAQPSREQVDHAIQATLLELF